MQTVNNYYLSSSRTYLEDQIKKNAFILIKDGIISAIHEQPQPGIKILDLGNHKILPGLIDLHIHGREGCDVMDAKLSSLETISASLSHYGIVGFLATTVTSSWEKSLAAFSIIGEAASKKMPGSQVLGAYNEGLFFSETHKGAHNETFFLTLTKERIDQIYSASNGSLKVFAMAPEVEGSADLIPYLKSLGVRVMLGHTNANFDQACCALNAGASGGVHVFNGMSGIHHRDPGCAGAVLMNDDAFTEVIADGVHLHPTILKMVYRLKGAKKITLISDCINAGGLSDGTYRLGELDVKVEKGVARTLKGSLAGSTLTLNRAIENFVNLAGISEVDAVNMASLIPAKFLGLSDSLGSIAVNKRACFAITDETGDVLATILDGNLVFSKNDRISEFF
jgi:N-acetylgalactosamine-6-phosphate deacetylase